MSQKLLLEISRCSILMSHLNQTNTNDSCSKVINFQKDLPQWQENDYQIPKPWSGDIVNAPILVISSNPAHSKTELYPTIAWPDDMIVDFFNNRFKDRGEAYSWVYNNKVLNRDGTSGASVRYWSSIKNRIQELLGYEPKPGIDYCITELVHCKSSKQCGVNKALLTCKDMFLKRILDCSRAKLIVAVGSIVRKNFDEQPEKNGMPIIYLPHPNAFIPKKLSDHYNFDDIEKYRKMICCNNIIDSGSADKNIKNFIDEQIVSCKNENKNTM